MPPKFKKKKAEGTAARKKNPGDRQTLMFMESGQWTRAQVPGNRLNGPPAATITGEWFTPPVVFPGSGTDPFLPPDPRSLVNYHPSVRHLVGGLKSYYHYTSMRNLDQILREGVIRPSYRQGLWHGSGIYLTKVDPSKGRDFVTSVIFNRDNVPGIGAKEPRSEACIHLKLNPFLIRNCVQLSKGRSVYKFAEGPIFLKPDRRHLWGFETVKNLSVSVGNNIEVITSVRPPVPDQPPQPPSPAAHNAEAAAEDQVPVKVFAPAENTAPFPSASTSSEHQNFSPRFIQQSRFSRGSLEASPVAGGEDAHGSNRHCTKDYKTYDRNMQETEATDTKEDFWKGPQEESPSVSPPQSHGRRVQYTGFGGGATFASEHRKYLQRSASPEILVVYNSHHDNSVERKESPEEEEVDHRQNKRQRRDSWRHEQQRSLSHGAKQEFPPRQPVEEDVSSDSCFVFSGRVDPDNFAGSSGFESAFNVHLPRVLVAPWSAVGRTEEARVRTDACFSYP